MRDIDRFDSYFPLQQRSSESKKRYDRTGKSSGTAPCTNNSSLLLATVKALLVAAKQFLDKKNLVYR